jgi:hypothetical protein
MNRRLSTSTSTFVVDGELLLQEPRVDFCYSISRQCIQEVTTTLQIVAFGGALLCSMLHASSESLNLQVYLVHNSLQIKARVRLTLVARFAHCSTTAGLTHCMGTDYTGTEQKGGSLGLVPELILDSRV